MTFGRNLSEEFANQRQEALQQWLSKVVARPPLWCDALRLFLGLDAGPASPSATTFRYSDDKAASDDEMADAPSTDDGGNGGGGHGGAGRSDPFGNDLAGGGGGTAYSAELRWIVSRAQQAGCGVVTESTGFFRASVLVQVAPRASARHLEGAGGAALRGDAPSRPHHARWRAYTICRRLRPLSFCPQRAVELEY